MSSIFESLFKRVPAAPSTPSSVAAASRAINTVFSSVDPAKSRPSPDTALLTLTLDEELSKLLDPLLSKLNFQVEIFKLVGKFGSSSRSVCRAKGAGSEFFLIAVPFWILNEALDSHIAAFSFLSYAFEKSSRVFIFSRDLDAMDSSFESMIDEWRQSRSISAKFISWRHITKIKDLKNDEARIDLLRSILGLSNVPAGLYTPLVLASTPVDPQARDTIVQELVRLQQDPLLESPKEFMKNLVLAASLPNSGQLNDKWSGDVDTNALILVNWAVDFMVDFPVDSPHAGEPTLGWILKSILDKPIPPKSVQVLAEIILKHNLIRDPAVLQSIRIKAQPSNGTDKP